MARTYFVQLWFRIIALSLRLVEDREYTGECSRSAPVGHVSGKRTDLVESAHTDDAVQQDVAFSLTVLHLQCAALTHVANRIYQFHVEHLTDVRLAGFVHSGQVSLETDCLPTEIAGVVEVQIHLLLGCCLIEEHCTLQVSQDAV